MDAIDKRTFKICEAVVLGLTYYYLDSDKDRRKITDADKAKARKIIPSLPKGWMQKSDTYPWSCMNKKKKG